MNTATTAPAAPPLPDDLAAVLKRMRMPYLRAAAPEVLATARSQRWDPTEVLRVLLAEEARGRDEALGPPAAKPPDCPPGRPSPPGAKPIPRSRSRPSRP